jgi:hypothetical protein
MKDLSNRDFLEAGMNFTSWMFSERKILDAEMLQFATDVGCDWEQMIELVITQKNKSVEFRKVLKERLSARPSAFGWFEVGADYIFVVNMAATGVPAALLEGVLSGLRTELEAVSVRFGKRDQLNDLLRQLKQGDIEEKRKTLSRLKEFLRDEAMVQDEQKARSIGTRTNNPWVSGSFYLVAAGVIIVVLLVVAEHLSIWALPLVLTEAILIISILGALQLKNDERLSDESFIKLMGLSFRYLPLLRHREKD